MFGFLSAPCTGCSGKDYPVWRGTFCGLARCLTREFGPPARLLANRDATFVGLLGLALDPQESSWKLATCCQPFARPFALNEDHPAILHAAAVSLCGLSAKLSDDAQDEGGLRRSLSRFALRLTSPARDRAVAILNSTSFPTDEVIQKLNQQGTTELHTPLQADMPTASAFGTITAHLAKLLDRPSLNTPLQQLGSSWGSLVYWQDAWEDQRADKLKGRFNPLNLCSIDAIQHRISDAWHRFNTSLASLPLYRYSDLITQVKIASAERHQEFLQQVPEPRKKTDRKTEPRSRSCSSCCNLNGCSRCGDFLSFCDCLDGCDCCDCHS